jgi:hypothetical protein
MNRPLRVIGDGRLHFVRRAHTARERAAGRAAGRNDHARHGRIAVARLRPHRARCRRRSGDAGEAAMAGIAVIGDVAARVRGRQRLVAGRGVAAGRSIGGGDDDIGRAAA